MSTGEKQKLAIGECIILRKGADGLELFFATRDELPPMPGRNVSLNTKSISFEEATRLIPQYFEL